MTQAHGDASINSKLKAKCGEYIFQSKHIRTNWEDIELVNQHAASRKLSESNLMVEGNGNDPNSCSIGLGNCQVIIGHSREDEEACDKTLSSKDIEEAMTVNSGCHGLDLTSPDHPLVFTKISSSHNGETPPLDKTIIFMPKRKSSGLSAEIRKYGCGKETTEVPSFGEVSHVSEESSAYVTCRSDDTGMFSNFIEKQSLDKVKKRNPRRVTFEDKLIQTCDYEVHVTDVRHGCYSHSDQDRMHDQTCAQCTSLLNKSLLSEETNDSSLSDDSYLITSDEDSFLPLNKNTCMLENESRQQTGNNDFVITTERLDSHRRQTSDGCSSNHPSITLEERHSASPVHGDSKDIISEDDTIEFLYHDHQTGSMLIERQCPSAMSTHQDMSILECSHVSSCDETMLYDWRDFQLDDDNPPSAQPISQDILKLTDTEIRQMMQKYGEEAGPITSTTRMVYLQHLAKLQNDPNFAKRATNRQHTQGKTTMVYMYFYFYFYFFI